MSIPTKEEVLDKFRQYREYMRAGNSSVETALKLHDSFVEAFDEWQAAQGPVTREWFVERFGGFHPGIEIVFDRENGPELVCRKCGRWIKLHNPNRSDIETLVRVLGGTQ